MTSGLKAKAALSERGDDLYETPPVAVTALLERETLPSEVWEPACGPGAIVGVLRAAGHTVIATDLNDWACPHSESRRDFLLEQRAPDGCQCIITNPPYKLAQEFVLKARELVPKVGCS
jgi:methylase of polypeptide subunit release factors